MLHATLLLSQEVSETWRGRSYHGKKKMTIEMSREAAPPELALRFLSQVSVLLITLNRKMLAVIFIINLFNYLYFLPLKPQFNGIILTAKKLNFPTIVIIFHYHCHF